MLRITLSSIALILAVMCTTHANAQFILDDSGVFTIRSFNVVGGGGSNDNDLNSTTETGVIWSHLDANPGFTGTTPNLGGPGGGIYNVANNDTTTAAVVNYDGGNFGGDIPYPSGNYGGVDFSYRAQAILEFTAGGTYTIGDGSDDGRILNLSEALPGSAPGFTGFTAFAGQTTAGLNTATSVGFDGTTGHNNSRAEFTVTAGDILALDAFFFERGGGDSFEVFIAQGNIGTGYSGGFSILQDDIFNGGTPGAGAIQLHSSIEAVVPEPASVAIWSLIGLGLAGFGYYRVRRKK